MLTLHKTCYRSLHNSITNLLYPNNEQTSLFVAIQQRFHEYATPPESCARKGADPLSRASTPLRALESRVGVVHAKVVVRCQKPIHAQPLASLVIVVDVHV